MTKSLLDNSTGIITRKLVWIIGLGLLPWLGGCGYPTPGESGLTPYVVVVTPTPVPGGGTPSPVTTPTPAATSTPSPRPATATPSATARPSTPTPRRTTVAPTLAVNLDDTYTIKSGDTLLGISIRLNVDYDELVELNKIADPNTIRIDQVLKLPARKTPVSPTPTIRS